MVQGNKYDSLVYGAGPRDQADMCLKVNARYTCPRCNIPYCSLACYKSEGHMTCSESFYKDCFMEGLENQDVSQDEKKKMLEMLERVEQEDQDFLDSDDDEEDLHERLAGLDLDNDAEEIWNRLTDKEKEDFQKMTADGRLGNLVEVWTPWWQVKDNKIQEVGKDSSKSSNLPNIVKDIPDIATLLKNSKPSADLKNNVINILYAYAFVCRLHNGDHMTSCVESAKDLLAVSEVLDQNVVCTSGPQAVQYCMKQIQQNPALRVPQDFQASVIHDVIALLKGPSNSEPLKFVLCALSQVHDIICKCQRTERKDSKSHNGEGHSVLDRKMLSGLKKKLKFLLGWTERFGMALHSLIPELQLEYCAVQSDLSEQGQTQEAVEKNLPNLRRKSPGKPLIQELA
ncbi:hypothetical protein FSP39_023131 [Pinctada imbricata]|uniref:HIT-type domain-containing protein n=1 Tax=Pinctada imbricata TaxID=66713 RepID=A0AA88YSV4_PINIB|nr:hypothetical protein FSP39_023131 [Pinctada imbricata]